MAQHEQFNLERALSEENMVDPQGRKWEIKGEREHGLVHARPNPDRADAQIPADFSGRWTSPSLLKGKIERWISKQWDMAENAARTAGRKAHAAAVEATEVAKKTAEESLAELPDEVKEVLGNIIAVKEEEEEVKAETKPATKKKVAKKKVTK